MTLASTNITASLTEELQRKATEAATKFDAVESEFLRLEKNLAIEQRRRAEADTQMEVEIERILTGVTSTVEGALDKQLTKLAHNIAIVTAKVDEMAAAVVADRQRTEEVLQIIRQGNAETLSEVQQKIELLKSDRLRKEMEKLNDINREMQRMQERVNLEVHMREAAGVSLKDLLAATMRSDVDEDARDKQKVQLLEEIDTLKASIVLEIQARRASEENFARTMEVLVGHLGSSMKRAIR
jgi:hypothetical protein